MSDQQRMQDIETLERWLNEQPMPRPDAQTIERVKAAVCAVAAGATAAAPPQAVILAKTRVRAAAHASRTRPESGRSGVIRRIYPWLSAAASIGLVVLAVQTRTVNVPVLDGMFPVATAAAELVDLELDMLDIEWQAHARDLALFGSDSERLAAELDDLGDPDYLINFSEWFDEEGA